MDEAERLCDRVMLVHQDRVAALDTSARLAERAGDGTHMTFLPSAPFLDEVLTHLAGVSSMERAGERIRVTGTGDLVPTVLDALEGVGVDAHQVQVESASLEDAFVRLTHHVSPTPSPMEVGRR